jgi:hypothetical protein
MTSCGTKQNGDTEIIDGVKVIKNGNFPSDRNISIKSELLFTLNEDSDDTTAVIRSVTAIDVDHNGNVYILDRRKSRIFKFSSQGDLILSFGDRGNGPGELMRPTEILLQNDSVYVPDMRLRKILVFSSDGKFIRDIIPLRDNGLPQNIEEIGNGNFAGILFNMGGGGRGPGPRTVEISVSLLDSKFEKTADMFSKKIEVDMRDFNPLDHQNKFTAGKGEIYIAENSEDKFLINVFDGSGKKTGEIRKSYAKTVYTDEEKIQLEKLIRSEFRWREPDLSKLRYKKAVENIFFHSEGYLLIESPKKRDENNRFNFMLDIFKDGVYLNTVDINSNNPDFYANEDGFQKIMKGDKLFVFNLDDNIIYVYRLKIIV